MSLNIVFVFFSRDFSNYIEPLPTLKFTISPPNNSDVIDGLMLPRGYIMVRHPGAEEGFYCTFNGIFVD